MSKIPPFEDILSGFDNGSNRTFELDLQRGIMKAEPGEDYRNMMEAIKEHKSILMMQTQAKATEAQPVATTAQTQQSPSPNLRQVIEHWLLTGTSALTKSSIDSYKLAINHFAAFHGDHLYIASIRKHHIAEWVAQLTKEGKTNTTRRKMTSHLTVFFDAAITNGYYPEELKNPAAGVVKMRQTEKTRRAKEFGWGAFTLEHLHMIFTAENLRMAEMPHTRRALVIGLYTGARVGEVAQLRVDSFRHEEGVDFLEFNGELKNVTSQRLIPIHPDLVQLGLLDWVAAEKKLGNKLLFPSVDIKKNKGGAISKGTSNLLKYLGIKIEEGKSNRLGFHSLRNNVIQELQGNIKFPEERRRVYVGHKSGDSENYSSHRAVYMRLWKPEEITPLFEGLVWGKWLDFDGLKSLLAEREPNTAFIADKRNAARAATRSRVKAEKQKNTSLKSAAFK